MRIRACVIIAAAVVLNACATSFPTGSTVPGSEPPTASAAGVVPSLTPDTTPDLTPPPTSTPSPPPLVAGDIAEVVTNDLVVRSLPEISDQSVIHRARLDAGKRLFVLDGPVAADGYDWYRVQPFGRDANRGINWPPAGWVAAGSQQGEPWIVAHTVGCPRSTAVETAQLAKLHPLEGLACFGHQPIRVRAQYMICPGTVPDVPPVPNFVIAPEWLGQGQGCALHTAEGITVYEAATPFFEPGIVEEVPPHWFWLSGQFDHPAAQSCVFRRQAGNPDMPAAPDLDHAQTVLLCRSHFAVAAVEPARAPAD